jgi:tetratricopeptide (TPR) repeat protein
LLRTAYRIDSETTKRALILRDSFTFLVLGLMTLVLFAVTLFLFRSFKGHRAELATSFAAEGRTELLQGKPADAVKSLRAALAYAPDDYSSQLLLAQALADSGEIDQATNYFMNLWEARPGDGFLNLQLAKLERRKGNRVDAIRYYRDSIFGDWRGDGTVKRRDVRLELVAYLMSGGDYPAARAELLIAAGNAPDNLEFNLSFADKLRAIGDASDSLTYYQKALADDPGNSQALEGLSQLGIAETP